MCGTPHLPQIRLSPLPFVSDSPWLLVDFVAGAIKFQRFQIIVLRARSEVRRLKGKQILTFGGIEWSAKRNSELLLTNKAIWTLLIVAQTTCAVWLARVLDKKQEEACWRTQKHSFRVWSEISVTRLLLRFFSGCKIDISNFWSALISDYFESISTKIDRDKQIKSWPTRAFV